MEEEEETVEVEKPENRKSDGVRISVEVEVRETDSINAQHLRNMELYLDTMDDDVLFETVHTLRNEVKYLNLENEICENFLLANEPTLIAGMDHILETAGKLQAYHMFTTSTSAPSQTSIHSARLSTVTGTSSRMGDKGPRINLSQRTDLVLREVENLKENLDKFIARVKRRKSNMKAELEEIGIRQGEINDTIKSFENSVVIEGVDSLTGRIPAEKFIKYMQDWLKNAQFLVEKMRLRLSTSKDKYIKTRVTLAQKEEIGESIREVDFEKIIIENQKYIERIEQKNIHLIELKKMTGRANLVLSTHKKFLLSQVDKLKQLRNEVEETKILTTELEQEGEEAIISVELEKGKYERIKTFVENYRVPDVLEYVKLKKQLHDLRREVKVWTRKNGILLIAVQSKVKELKKLSGIRKTQTEWLQPFKHSTFASMDSLSSIFSNESGESAVQSYITIDFDEILNK